MVRDRGSPPRNECSIPLQQIAREGLYEAETWLGTDKFVTTPILRRDGLLLAGTACSLCPPSPANSNSSNRIDVVCDMPRERSSSRAFALSNRTFWFLVSGFCFCCLGENPFGRSLSRASIQSCRYACEMYSVCTVQNKTGSWHRINTSIHKNIQSHQ